MNTGPFEVAAMNRDEDLYGRKLRILVRNRRSLAISSWPKGLPAHGTDVADPGADRCACTRQDAS